MATTTTNFGLKKYEGTDLFNPLTFENPNTDDIDSAMFYNKQHNCVDATELTTGTVHAITKTDTDSPLFSFSATSNYHFGDTFTLNGSPVTALLTSGEVLPEGAYVIGSRVLGFVSGGGSLITLYIMKTTDLTPINTIIGNTNISGIADGTLTGAVSAMNGDLENLKLNTFGTAVDIAGHVSGDPYTVPADGIVRVNYAYSQTGYIYVSIGGMIFYTSKTHNNGSFDWCLAVRKGMQVYVSQTSLTTPAVFFVPYA